MLRNFFWTNGRLVVGVQDHLILAHSILKGSSMESFVAGTYDGETVVYTDSRGEVPKPYQMAYLLARQEEETIEVAAARTVLEGRLNPFISAIPHEDGTVGFSIISDEGRIIQFTTLMPNNNSMTDDGRVYNQTVGMTVDAQHEGQINLNIGELQTALIQGGILKGMSFGYAYDVLVEPVGGKVQITIPKLRIQYDWKQDPRFHAPVSFTLDTLELSQAISDMAVQREEGNETFKREWGQFGDPDIGWEDDYEDDDERLGATVEDSEPTNNFSFLTEPHDELYPPAWEKRGKEAAWNPIQWKVGDEVVIVNQNLRNNPPGYEPKVSPGTVGVISIVSEDGWIEVQFPNPNPSGNPFDGPRDYFRADELAPADLVDPTGDLWEDTFPEDWTKGAAVSLKDYGTCPYCLSKNTVTTKGRAHNKLGWKHCNDCGRDFDPMRQPKFYIGQKVRLIRSHPTDLRSGVSLGSEGTVSKMSQNPVNGYWQTQVSFPLIKPIESDPNAIFLPGEGPLGLGGLTQEHIDMINRGEATLPHPQEGSTNYVNWFGDIDLEPVDEMPDSLPWTEEEQEYYRTADFDEEALQKAIDETKAWMVPQGMNEPDWSPLEAVLPPEHQGGWMWMGYGPGGLRQYKNGLTRRYLFLLTREEAEQSEWAKYFPAADYPTMPDYATAGQQVIAFQYMDHATGAPHKYVPIPLEQAIDRAYEGIEGMFGANPVDPRATTYDDEYRGLRDKALKDEGWTVMGAKDIEEEIRRVAEQIKPDGGYGEVSWNPNTKTVFWISADWTTNEELIAAEDLFLSIPGVERFEYEAEAAVMEGNGWERVAEIATPGLDTGTYYDLEFNVDEERDRGWRSYIIPGKEAAPYVDQFNLWGTIHSPEGISWESAREFLWMIANNEIKRVLETIPENTEWHSSQALLSYPSEWVIEKIPNDHVSKVAATPWTMRPEAKEKIKAHFFDALKEDFPDADNFIYMTVFGSGASFNWDEEGDFDVQCWVDHSKYSGDLSPDDLVAEIRRLTQPTNFPSFKELGLTPTKKESSLQPLPIEEGLYYRFHHNDADFGTEYAQSEPIWTPPKEEWPIEDIWSAKPGYSAFWNPHHLGEYLQEQGWADAEDAQYRNVIAFRGTPIGEGYDGEPLVQPESEILETIPLEEFLDRLEITPNGYGRWGEHTWGDGPNGQIVDDGYRSLRDISASVDGPFYHGTNQSFQPGDVLVPASERGQSPNYENAALYDPSWVYLSTEDHLAERYAVSVAGRFGGEPHVYEVRPLEDLRPDPEQESGWSSDQYIAKTAEIVQEIPLPGLVYWQEANDEWEQPGMRRRRLASVDADGSMLIQYYAKPGTGSYEENIAQKPYACYDMETDEWIVEPKVVGPEHWGQVFLMVKPKAEMVAQQAEAMIESYERNVTDAQFWFELNQEHSSHSYEVEWKTARKNAELDRQGIKNLFLNIFQGRSKAYGEGGRGIEDERDILQKMLEVWGTFQRLRHITKETLPWEVQEMPDELKTAAAPQIMYHVSPGINRDSILQHGLDRDKGQSMWEGFQDSTDPDWVDWNENRYKDGIYLFEDLIDAESYTSEFENPDIWEVNVDDPSILQPDPETAYLRDYYETEPEDERPFIPDYWYTTSVIPPDKIKLVSKVKTAEWWEDPDIADYQQGMCDTYALAMLEMYPQLRMGTLVSLYEEDGEQYEAEEHWFAHDEKYAYDSYGRHSLPYTGLNDYPLEQRLDQDPSNWFFPDSYGENAGPEDYERAKSLILQQHPYLKTKTAMAEYEDLVRYAIGSWKGSASNMRIHMHNELNGEPEPTNEGARHMRLAARALLEELRTNAQPITNTLYRGTKLFPDNLPASFSEDPHIAQEFGSQVYVLKEGSGLRVNDYIGGAYGDEREWLVMGPFEYVSEAGKGTLIKQAMADITRSTKKVVVCPNCGSDDSSEEVAENTLQCLDCGHAFPSTRRLTTFVVYKAFVDGVEVGHLSLDKNNAISNIYVEPAYRRQGIATDLLNQAKADGVDVQHSERLSPEGESWMQSLGMAERSGDPELDALIEEYMSSVYSDRWPDGWEGIYDEGDIEGVEKWNDPMPITNLQHPGISSGMCYIIADEFATFLENRGIRATTTADEPEGFPWVDEGRDPTFQDFGFEKGISDIPHDEHHWVIVNKDGHTFGIDFTASQFGYTEFPMVQRLDDQGSWQRKWAMAERSGDPELDKLIEEFIETELPRGYGTVQNMSDPMQSRNMCWITTMTFLHYLNDHGYPQPQSYGYPQPTEENTFQTQDHIWNRVKVPSGDYSIDWTSRQLGETEWPLVKKLDEGGQWQRKWTAAVDETKCRGCGSTDIRIMGATGDIIECMDCGYVYDRPEPYVLNDRKLDIELFKHPRGYGKVAALPPEERDRLTQHVETLAKQLNAEVNWEEPFLSDEDAWADMYSITTRPIVNDIDYLVAMHELGHHAAYKEIGALDKRLDFQMDEDISEFEMQIDEEAIAWEWAIENSLIPVTSEMVAQANQWINTYILDPEALAWHNDQPMRMSPAFDSLRKRMPSQAKIAMPYDNNTWYHVTNKSNLYGIANEGLQPRSWGTTQMFYLPAEQDAVYLWPTVGAAEGWARSFAGGGRGHGGPTDPMILRVTGIDLSKVAPDHEEFSHWLIDNILNGGEDEDGNRIEIDEQAYYAIWSILDTVYTGEVESGDIGFDESINLLRLLDPAIRTELARELSINSGSPIMYYGSVPPENIDIAAANIFDLEEGYEDVYDRFLEDSGWMEENPEPEYDVEGYDEWVDEKDTAFQQWIDSNGPWLNAEDLRDYIENAEYHEDYDDDFAHYYNYTPIDDHARNLGLPGF